MPFPAAAAIELEHGTLTWPDCLQPCPSLGPRQGLVTNPWGICVEAPHADRAALCGATALQSHERPTPLELKPDVQVVEAAAPGSPLYGKGWVGTSPHPTVPVWAPAATPQTIYTNP